MLLFLIFATIIIILMCGYVAMAVKKDRDKSYNFLAGALVNLGILIFMIILSAILHSTSAEDYNRENEYLTYAYYHSDEITLNDLHERNNSLREKQRFNKNIWLDWFIPNDVNDCEYIIIDGRIV